MAKKKKYYVVWDGHSPGVYDSWNTCQKQIKAYPNAKYKSFESQDEAIIAFNGNYFDFVGKNTKATKSKVKISRDQILKNTWSVDAACSGNPGLMEYRGVVTDTHQEIFKQGPFQNGTNNIGEFLALVHALALLKKMGDDKRVIYTDSRTALSWIKHKKVKTVLKKDHRNAIIFELIERAISWLKSNSYSNKLVKWETKSWGEIPADFGRK